MLNQALAPFERMPRFAILAILLCAAPAFAADRARWGHPAGAFERDQDGSWSEEVRTDDGVLRYEFEETARDGDSITLYDRGRDCTVRIFAEAVEVKNPNEGVPEFRVFYRGKFLPARDRWGYLDGSFEPSGHEAWVQKDRAGAILHELTEMDRSADYITLFEKDRDYIIRIYETSAEVLDSDEEVKSVYEGEWFKPPGVTTGRISLTNDYSESVWIQLQHGDGAPGSVFASYRFDPGQTGFLQHDGSDLVLGANWVVTVRFNNGKTRSQPVGPVAEFEEGIFRLKASQVK